MAQRAAGEIPGTDIPLVVDVDGTFLRSDLLVEGGLTLLKVQPLRLLALTVAVLRQGKAALKAGVAAASGLDATALPVTAELLAFLQQERARERKIYLASGADHFHVAVLCGHYDLFDGFFASDGVVSLSGAAKAERLVQAFGAGGFDYAGNAAADLPVWAVARRVIVVNASSSLRQVVRNRFADVMEIAPQRGLPGACLQALRPHQWVKNALLFLPMLTAHAISLPGVLTLLVAFLSFGLVASAVYLINDMLDLQADRHHLRKRLRPLASGAVPVLTAMGVVPFLLLAGGGLSLLVSGGFAALLALYFGLTLLYSLWLKQKPIVDVMVLAGLYTLRVVAGGAAIAVAPSAWLLAFSIFLFLSLALVKRLAELHGRRRNDLADPVGRGYSLDDLPLLQGLAVAAGYAAVLVLALYVNSPTVTALYAVPQGLWLICGVLLYWISRILLLTHRGEMHDDPVVFAIRDPVSLSVFALSVAIVLGCALR